VPPVCYLLFTAVRCCLLSSGLNVTFVASCLAMHSPKHCNLAPPFGLWHLRAPAPRTLPHRDP
jgi:hypothetical protein